jgi:Ca-activated chloride channel family protein
MPYARRLGRLGALALTLAALAAPGWGQSGRRPTPQQPKDATGGEPGADVQLGTQEVLLAVTVRDAAGRPITNLTKDEFIVAENRVRQTLVSCQIASVPVNVVLVLDASGSVFTKHTSIRRAAEGFVAKLGPEDRVSVVQFADKVELLQDWTSDREDVKHAIDWRYRGGDATTFWDAVYLAAEEQLSKVEGRRAIIILSDGVDTSSKVTEEQALAALDRTGATVYVVSEAQALIERARPYAGVGGVIQGTAPRARYAILTLEAAQEKMRRLADRYGGRLFAPIEDADLGTAYDDVAAELKRQYVITYNPQNEARDGRWRSIEIYLTRPGLVARTRRGYVAE